MSVVLTAFSYILCVCLMNNAYSLGCHSRSVMSDSYFWYVAGTQSTFVIQTHETTLYEYYCLDLKAFLGSYPAVVFNSDVQQGSQCLFQTPDLEPIGLAHLPEVTT